MIYMSIQSQFITMWNHLSRIVVICICLSSKSSGEVLDKARSYAAALDTKIPIQTNPAPQTGPTLKVNVDWIATLVRVLDGQGQAVKGLTAADFNVTDDDTVQEKFALDSGQAVASASLMIDVGIDDGAAYRAGKIAGFRDLFIREFQKRNAVVGLHPFAAGWCLSHAGFIGTIMMQPSDVSNSFDECYERYQQSKSRIYKDLYQLDGELLGVIASISYYDRSEKPLSKSAIFIIAERPDNDSANWVKKTVPEYAIEKRAVIFPIVLGSARKDRRRLKNLAKLTNGVYSEAKSVEDLKTIFTADLRDLDSLYTISFPISHNSRRPTHRLKIIIPNHPDYRLIYRERYDDREH